jgi:hypothetical protein
VSGNKIDTTGSSWGGGGMNVHSTGIGRLVNSHIHDNVVMASGYAYGGGASVRSIVTVVWENVTVERNLLVLNTSSDSVGYGGGLYVDASLTLRGCTIRDNKLVLGSAEASRWVDLFGGGVYSRNQLALVDCNVTSNHVTALPALALTMTAGGGGVYQIRNSATGRLNITRTTIRANIVTVGGSSLDTSYARGGGESIDAWTSCEAKTVVCRSDHVRSIRMMCAWSCAALMSENDVAIIAADLIIAENRVIAKHNGQGGGVYSLSRRVTMTRCSIYANSLQVIGQAGSAVALSGLGGGLYFGSASSIGGTSGARSSLQWCNITANLVNVTSVSALATAAAGGGGIAVDGPSTRVNLTAAWVQGNRVMQLGRALAGASTYARGGGVLVTDSCELSVVGTAASAFVNNRAQSSSSAAGGAAYATSTGTLRLGTARVVVHTGAALADTVVNTVVVPTPAPTAAPTTVGASERGLAGPNTHSLVSDLSGRSLCASAFPCPGDGP